MVGYGWRKCMFMPSEIPNIQLMRGRWLAGRSASRPAGRNFNIFLDFSEMSQKASPGALGHYFPLFSAYFCSIFGPPGGSGGEPWGPPIFLILGCCLRWGCPLLSAAASCVHSSMAYCETSMLATEVKAYVGIARLIDQCA